MGKDPIIVRFNKAVQLEKNGLFDQALKEYAAIISEAPHFRKALINFGALLSRLNRLSEAMKCFEAALALGEDFLTHFNIGCIYYKRGEYQYACRSLETAAAMNKRFPLARLVLGLCHSRLNNLAEAEKNFSATLRHDPANRVALTALAILSMNNRQYDTALSFAERLLAYNPSNSRIRQLKADILMKLGKYDESAAEMKTIRKISKGYASYDEFIKTIPVDILSDRYGTIDHKIEALQSKTTDAPELLLSLSLCHLLKGDPDKAIECLFAMKKKKARVNN